MSQLDVSHAATFQPANDSGEEDGLNAVDSDRLLSELSLFREVSLAVSSSLELEKVLEVIARSVLRFTETEIATVFLVRSGPEIAQAITIPPEKAFLRTVPRSGGLTKLIIDSRKPVIIPDTLTDDRVNPEVVAKGIRSVLGMPLVVGSEVLGVLYLNSLFPQHFTRHTVDFLSVLASQMGIALRNARLYAEAVWEKEKLAAIFQHSTDGIMIVDRQRRIVDVNPGFVSLVGWEVGEAIGRSCSEILGCVDHLGCHLCAGGCPIEKAMSGGVSLPHIETTIVAKDGRSLEIAASCSLVPQPGNEPPLLVCFLRDFTTLRLAERVKSDFVSTISHELRTPLSIIKGYTTTLLRPNMNLPEEQRHRFLQNVDRASDRLIRLIEDLLNVSRMEGGQLTLKPQLFDLRDVITKVIGENQLSSDQSHRIDVRLPKTPLDAMADPFRIEEVLHNLVDNAIKYSPGCAAIRVAARRVRRDSQAFATKLPSAPWSLVISVADSGIGITPEQAAHIFEKFYRGETGLTRRTRGLGVGLYLSKGLVEAHGGRIWVDSKPGRGSTFFFSLPAAKQTKKD